MAKFKFEPPKPIKSRNEVSWIRNVVFTPIEAIIIAAILLLIVLILIQYWSKEYGKVFEEKIIQLRELQENKINLYK